MPFEIVPAVGISLDEHALVANRAFAGYVAGWTDLNAETLARFILLQGTDLFYSRFVRANDGLVGFGHINRTGDIPRLSGMAIEAAARGTGAADFLMRHLLDEAQARGDRAMMLEVIEQNPRAHRFYKRYGFRELTRLVGWRRNAGAAGELVSGADIEEVPILDALKLPVATDYPTLPWQITRFAVAKLTVARVFRSGDVCVVVNDSGTGPIRVHSFLSASGDRDTFRDALARVMRHYADREFFTPAVFPEEFGTKIFQQLGFRPEPLSQFLMRRDF